MGRYMLIMVTLVFIVLGMVQVNTLEKREQVTETNVEAYQKEQGKNRALSGFELGIRNLIKNKSWRGPSTVTLDGEDITLQAEDYSTNPDLSYGQLLIKVYTNINGRMDSTQGRVYRGGVIPPVYSAVGFYSDSLDFDADGKAFEISGSDKNLDGTTGPASDLHGIKTTTQNSYDTVYNELENVSPDQTGNVTGEGGTPSMEADSTMTTGDLGELVQKYLDNADYVYGDGEHGDVPMGTDDDPKITVVEQAADVKFNGSGAGVLLVQEDATLTLSGDLDFHGIVLNRGALGQNSGNVTIYGGLIFGSNSSSYQSLEIDGNVNIFYSTEALAIAEQALNEEEFEYQVLNYYE